MKPPRHHTSDDPESSDTPIPYRRRRFLAVGAGLGAAALAGCTGDTGPGASEDAPDDSDGSASGADSGTFRLLISDRPAAIDDFDELNVSFDRARVFRAGNEDDESDSTPTATATPTATPGNVTATDTSTETDSSPTSPTATATDAEDAEGAEDADDADDENGGKGEGNADESAGEQDDGDGQRGFSVIDLEGETVDLTQVVGDKAIGVFEGELEEGRYTKVELHARDVEGIVNGEQAQVKLPSGKLQIVKPFEVVAGETLSFVFDINVVEKGNTGEYNLLPVISESGVTGEDVEVTEVDENGEPTEAGESEPTDTEASEATETPESEPTETEDPEDGSGGGNGGDGGGPPDEDS